MFFIFKSKTKSLDHAVLTNVTPNQHHLLVDYILVKDQKGSGANSGTFTLGGWRRRDINTEEIDTGGHCSISSNQITLAAGTYECIIKCPAFLVNEHLIRLWNTTDGALLLMGSNEYADTANGGHNSSFIIGRFTIGGSKVLEIQHFCLATQTTNGFGKSISLGSAECFTIAEFRKVA